MNLKDIRKLNDDAATRDHKEILCASRFSVTLDPKVMPEEISDNFEAGQTIDPSLLTPDKWKGYLTYEICRSMPHVAGPAMSGNFTALHPAVVERNHHSLFGQQLNLDHRLKAYDPDNIPRDRIIGAIMHTSFPEWGDKPIPETSEEAPFMTVTAAIWKLAEGVSKFLGDHLSGKLTYAVSIEMISNLENLGIYVPSTRDIFDLLDAPDTVTDAISQHPETGQMMLGRTTTGEQLAWAYGKKDGIVDFRGTGVVEFPADKTARIAKINASGQPQDDQESESGDNGAEGGGSAPEATPEEQPASNPEVVIEVGSGYKFSTGSEATIIAIHSEGSHGVAGQFTMQASEEDPVVEFQLLDSKKKIYKKKSQMTK